MYKKIAVSVLSVGLLATPLFSSSSFASEISTSDKVLYSKQELSAEQVADDKAQDEITVDGVKLAPEEAVVTSELVEEGTKKELESTVEQGTQLLEMKQTGEDTYQGSYVTIASAATTSISNEDKTTGGKVLLKVYYHVQYDKHNVKHYDMNYIQTKYTPSSGATISGRYVNMGQTGWSSWGGYVTQRNNGVKISTNSLKTTNAPDKWAPISRGIGGANAHAKVSYKGKTYSLDVTSNFVQ
ncbi:MULTISPECIES: hypothetical protein [Priestia]|uniref:hypothetical protein n=1 Tax=Priestia TaxID=2800373 RepID=UPI002E1B2118|nr:hypothetical protein [Priestia aryabhattai]